ncbi:hypothetical protein Syun_023238 [Stephania yunnanensis]|uniref:Uncharacterized protein n=1 Tax=Stephania yunnanensis TaxID=152371 RepID=A0AAP0FBM2_9MAGN
MARKPLFTMLCLIISCRRSVPLLTFDSISVKFSHARLFFIAHMKSADDGRLATFDRVHERLREVLWVERIYTLVLENDAGVPQISNTPAKSFLGQINALIAGVTNFLSVGELAVKTTRRGDGDGGEEQKLQGRRVAGDGAARKSCWGRQPASSEGQRRDGALAHEKQLSVTAGADDSDGPAVAVVDDATLPMLGVVVVAYKGERKNKKDLPKALKKEISILICRKNVDLC